MNFARTPASIVCLLLALCVFACSSSEQPPSGASSSGKPSSDGQGSDGEGSDGEGQGSGESSSGTSSTSTEQTCRSSAANGQCLEGPKKGASCCMPDEEEGVTCDEGTDCDTVCKYCE